MPARRNLVCLLHGLGLSLMAATLQAATAVPDDLIIDAFPRSEVAQVRTSENTEHGVVIGSIRRINNQLRAEREVRTTGELVRVSWLIPTGHDSQEALMHAKRQLLERDHAMLFFCEVESAAAAVSGLTRCLASQGSTDLKTGRPMLPCVSMMTSASALSASTPLRAATVRFICTLISSPPMSL